eukprot:snap_masked-scaffold_13-processed-gene-5.37-mRNA-1 protein AED:1.00 eAED:1.00 QI:0/-1/0/0/-1/1/1/0/359
MDSAFSMEKFKNTIFMGDLNITFKPMLSKKEVKTSASSFLPLLFCIYEIEGDTLDEFVSDLNKTVRQSLNTDYYLCMSLEEQKHVPSKTDEKDFIEFLTEFSKYGAVVFKVKTHIWTDPSIQFAIKFCQQSQTCAIFSFNSAPYFFLELKKLQRELPDVNINVETLSKIDAELVSITKSFLWTKCLNASESGLYFSTRSNISKLLELNCFRVTNLSLNLFEVCDLSTTIILLSTFREHHYLRKLKLNGKYIDKPVLKIYRLFYQKDQFKYILTPPNHSFVEFNLLVSLLPIKEGIEFRKNLMNYDGFSSQEMQKYHIEFNRDLKKDVINLGNIKQRKSLLSTADFETVSFSAFMSNLSQ